MIAVKNKSTKEPPLNKVFASIIFFATAFTLQAEEPTRPDQIVTNMYWKQGGRFGAQLYYFTKAFIFSKMNRIPLYYTYKEHFEKLSIDEYFKPFVEEEFSDYQKVAVYEIDKYEDAADWKDTVFVCDSSTKLSVYRYLRKKRHPYLKELRHILKPKNEISLPPIPEGFTSVALHVRTGVGRDGPFLQDQTEFDPNVEYEDYKYPMRFLPLSFFIEQLEWVYNQLDQGPLFVRIFTDDPMPEEICRKIREHFEGFRMVFQTSNDNNYENHVVNDWWEMSLYDCLVRPDSDFSEMAALIGCHKLLVFPVHAHFEETKLIIDEIARMDLRR